MPFRWNPHEHLVQAQFFLRWLLFTILLSAVVGSACAFLLYALDYVTNLRFQTLTASGLPWLLYLLPIAGIFIVSVYRDFGQSVDGGNNLIIEQIHEPGGGVPARMAPLVLLCTLVTHLFGGSAGREGTAVQMGGSLASTLAKILHLKPENVRILLMAGVAAGFGAVFGTPLAGAIFAIEVLTIGVLSYEALIPCLLASIFADQVCIAWGTRHTQYSIASFSTKNLLQNPPHLDFLLVAKILLASVAFGLVSVLFAELTHSLTRLFKKITRPFLRPVVGSAAIIGLAFLLGRDYLGLGVTSPISTDITILSAFHAGGAAPFSWLWKLLLTAITVSCGFKGGEVTPLFFIGATLGNTLAHLLGAPPDLFAALGFVAVFAGATNTPLACTLMGIELFGPAPALYLAIACFFAYLFSGHNGIYLSQRIHAPLDLATNTTLRTRRDSRTTIQQFLMNLFSPRQK